LKTQQIKSPKQRVAPSLEFKVIDPSNDQRWNSFILHHQSGSLYHHWLWKELIQKTYGYQPFYFILEAGDAIRAAMPFFFINSHLTGTRMVSLPFSDCCIPLVNDSSEFAMLFEGAAAQLKNLNASYIELRSKIDIEPINGFDLKKEENYRNHVLELYGSIEEVQEKFHKSCVKRVIKKVQSCDLTLVRGNKAKDMKAFYHLYVLTRKRHGLPPQPYKFFENMWDLFYPSDMLNVLLAVNGSTPVSGIILSKFKDTMYYLYGGSNSKFHHLGPNHLLLWKAIQMAHSEGLKYFDFGRTAVDNQGLLDFKRRWGTKEYKIISYTYPKMKKQKLLFNRNGAKSGLFYSLTKKLPTPILELGGNLFYKHWG